MSPDAIIETYRGFVIRKSNRIYIRVSPDEYKRFIDNRIGGKSARRSIGLLCHCSDAPVIIKSKYHANGNS